LRTGGPVPVGWEAVAGGCGTLLEHARVAVKGEADECVLAECNDAVGTRRPARRRGRAGEQARLPSRRGNEKERERRIPRLTLLPRGEAPVVGDPASVRRERAEDPLSYEQSAVRAVELRDPDRLPVAVEVPRVDE